VNKSTKFLPPTPPISKSGFVIGAVLALVAGLFKIFFLTGGE
jgi:hypothetical protein